MAAPTAEEFFRNSLVQSSIDEYGNYSIYDIQEAMIEFAKLHVEEALKATNKYVFEASSINENLILNAYPLNLII